MYCEGCCSEMAAEGGKKKKKPKKGSSHCPKQLDTGSSTEQ